MKNNIKLNTPFAKTTAKNTSDQNSKKIGSSHYKIGIFGDSFAISGQVEWPQHHCTYKSWSRLVEEAFSNTENFACSGSSLYYSYLLLEENAHKFDKLILCVTNPGRKYLKNITQNHISGISHLDHLVSATVDVYEKKILTILRDYTIFVEEYDMVLFYHTLLLKEIFTTYNNILLIPCFFDSMPTCLMDIYASGRLAITKNLREQYAAKPDMNNFYLEKISNLDSGSSQWQDDMRLCHMNYENNQILYHKIKNWIEQGVFYPSCDDFIPSKYPQELYFSINYWRNKLRLK